MPSQSFRRNNQRVQVRRCLTCGRFESVSHMFQMPRLPACWTACLLANDDDDVCFNAPPIQPNCRDKTIMRIIDNGPRANPVWCAGVCRTRSLCCSASHVPRHPEHDTASAGTAPVEAHLTACTKFLQGGKIGSGHRAPKEVSCKSLPEPYSSSGAIESSASPPI